MNLSITDKAVYRKAPATPALLIISVFRISYWFLKVPNISKLAKNMKNYLNGPGKRLKGSLGG